MNERINELLLEAHRQTKGGIYSGHLSDWTEKFAELIVQECMREIRHKSFELLDIDFYPHYQELLKKHFGVEE